MRGSTFRGVRDHIDAEVPGGLSRVLSFLPDEAHRAFSSQVFLPVAMYDALPLIPLTEATALAEGLPYQQSVRQRARRVAQRDITGLYKLFFKAVSPPTAAERLQRAALRYFDFGKLEILERGPKRALIEHSGLPRFFTTWYLPMMEGYTSVVLEIAGAHHPTTRVEPLRRESNRAGLEVVTVRFEMMWDL